MTPERNMGARTHEGVRKCASRPEFRSLFQEFRVFPKNPPAIRHELSSLRSLSGKPDRLLGSDSGRDVLSAIPVRSPPPPRFLYGRADCSPGSVPSNRLPGPAQNRASFQLAPPRVGAPRFPCVPFVARPNADRRALIRISNPKIHIYSEIFNLGRKGARRANEPVQPGDDHGKRGAGHTRGGSLLFRSASVRSTSHCVGNAQMAVS